MKSLKMWCAVFGAVFLAAGVAGYLSLFVSDGKLLGLFQVDTMNNAFHALTGVLGLLVAAKGDYARMYLQVVGVVYVLAAIIGFVHSGNLFIMHVNMIDTVLYLALGAVAGYVGFIRKDIA